MSDFVFLQVQLHKVIFQIDSDCPIGLSARKILDKDVSDEIDPAAEGAIVIVKSLGRDGSIVKYIFFELNEKRDTFLSRLIVSSSMTLASPLGLCLRLLMAIFSPCRLEFLMISSI